ncbi:hypothetical protein ABDK00_001655 [Niabella insulamsoli]|uniref:hypothetical protein n=1 Tax=Niabella insulamsoli TaxID=3144874 RepID=UPI0032019AE0
MPFPTGPKRGEGDRVASGFDQQEGTLKDQYDSFGNPVIQVTDYSLGRYEFMPVVINDGLKDYNLPNAVIMISGEKGIIETDVIDRGTVFEKVYERPYDISIITTIHSDENLWPAEQYKEIAELYRGKRTDEQGKKIKGRDLVTLKCALTYPYLKSTNGEDETNNFLITRIAVLDNENSENTEVIQIDGRSNIEFELLIK